MELFNELFIEPVIKTKSQYVATETILSLMGFAFKFKKKLVIGKQLDWRFYLNCVNEKGNLSLIDMFVEGLTSQNNVIRYCCVYFLYQTWSSKKIKKLIYNISKDERKRRCVCIFCYFCILCMLFLYYLYTLHFLFFLYI